MPSFCAAVAIGPTGNPTIPNMNWTPCFLRFLATSVAPSTSAMNSSLSESGRKIGPRGAGVKPSRCLENEHAARGMGDLTAHDHLERLGERDLQHLDRFVRIGTRRALDRAARQ